VYSNQMKNGHGNIMATSCLIVKLDGVHLEKLVGN
jgi:hypothetical protein